MYQGFFSLPLQLCSYSSCGPFMKWRMDSVSSMIVLRAEYAYYYFCASGKGVWRNSILLSKFQRSDDYFRFYCISFLSINTCTIWQQYPCQESFARLIFGLQNFYIYAPDTGVLISEICCGLEGLCFMHLSKVEIVGLNPFAKRLIYPLHRGVTQCWSQWMRED